MVIWRHFSRNSSCPYRHRYGHWCGVMRKSLLSMLVLLLMASVPFGSHAASVHDNGYVSIGVPDLAQATAFFRNILDCEPIGLIAANESVESAHTVRATRNAPPSSRLLLCNSGTVVELFDNHGGSSPSPSRHSADHGNEPIPSFSTDDMADADRWLRREGVKVIGPPVIVRAGPQAGQTVVNFMAPWGLRLQLVGRNARQVATAP